MDGLLKQILVADNQELTAEGVHAVAERLVNTALLTASNRSEMIDLLEHHDACVVVLDFSLFDFSDIDSLLITSQRFEQCHWVLLSDEFTEYLLHRVLFESSSFSVVYKDAPLCEIEEALRYALQRQRVVSPKAMEMMLSRGADEVRQHEVLTATELEIAKAIAQGKSTKEIAAERYSSVHTITTHRKNIFRKLNVNTAHEVMRYALRSGWIDPVDFSI